MDDDPPVPVFIPALVALLAHAERIKGSPLTEGEVLAIRDRGVCMMVPGSSARELADKCGYDDIDPEFAWEEWQEVRASFYDD